MRSAHGREAVVILRLRSFFAIFEGGKKLREEIGGWMWLTRTHLADKYVLCLFL